MIFKNYADYSIKIYEYNNILILNQNINTNIQENSSRNLTEKKFICGWDASISVKRCSSHL